VAQEEAHGPSEATGKAALSAGWSHGHRDVSGGWLRPTVFGAVDGLVTNASLISGLGGGGVSAHTVVLTGAAALVAGAFSGPVVPHCCTGSAWRAADGAVGAERPARRLRG
jgi:VIT family